MPAPAPGSAGSFSTGAPPRSRSRQSAVPQRASRWRTPTSGRWSRRCARPRTRRSFARCIRRHVPRRCGARVRARRAGDRGLRAHPGLRALHRRSSTTCEGTGATVTAQEARGRDLFADERKGNCAACHPMTPAADGTPPLFTDFTYDNLGVPRNPDKPLLGAVVRGESAAAASSTRASAGRSRRPPRTASSRCRRCATSPAPRPTCTTAISAT